MPTLLFNPYDYRVLVVAENNVTKESYQLSVLPKTKAELLEGYSVSISTAVQHPKISILSGEIPVVEEKENIKKGN